MPESQFPEGHHSIKRSLWQRWTSWSGSFLVISVLLHILLLGGATVLVVQVVQNRKDKMKFTAPPPSANASVEHKVKPSKKTAAAAPAISKRITSTAVNAAVSLPSMDLSSTGPDVMASVMSGMGASGLGSGAGGGAAGMASMPLAGLTAFGFKGATTGGLVGHFYDLTRNPDKTPTAAVKQSTGSPAYYQVVSEFFSKNWDEAVLKRYYCARDTMLAVQMYMPCSGSSGAAKAFNVENEVKNPLWLIHYKGAVVAPFDGEFRFWASADDFMAIRFDGVPVLSSPGLKQYMPKEGLPFAVPKPNPPSNNQQYQQADKQKIGLSAGSWIRVEQGKSYPIDIVIGDTGGLYQQILMIQSMNPPTPYPKSTNDPTRTVLPLVQFRRGIPLPTFDPKASSDYSRNPEFAPFSIIFPAK